MSQLDQPETGRHENVKAWLETVPDNALYLSAVTVMEAWKGLARQRKKSANDPKHLRDCATYEEALEKLVEAFSDRVVPIDETVAKVWGKMLGQQDKHLIDVCLAATAITHDMIIATRNTKDFLGRGASLVNPFSQNLFVETLSS